MMAYVCVGADDMAAAARFYTAILPALGYRMERHRGDLSFLPDAAPGAPDFYVKAPFDGQPATAGNGTMVAFEAADQRQVRALHAAGVAAGGSDAGAPGFRADYGPRFYVGYLRDPQGNKIALFSSNSADPARDDAARGGPQAD